MVSSPCASSVATVASPVDMSVKTGFAFLSVAVGLAFFGRLVLGKERSGNWALSLQIGTSLSSHCLDKADPSCAFRALHIHRRIAPEPVEKPMHRYRSPTCGALRVG